MFHQIAAVEPKWRVIFDSAPRIAPLKGGGAIRRLGAKLCANFVTSTGSLSISIAPLLDAADPTRAFSHTMPRQWNPEESEPRIVYRTTYCIRRYRPRVEGLFARIERFLSRIALGIRAGLARVCELS
jgi:hypothetical protein